MKNRYILHEKVREYSYDKTKEWKLLIEEWEIVDYKENRDDIYECICSKTDIVFVSTIRNIYNGYILFPIGSKCIDTHFLPKHKDELKQLRKNYRKIMSYGDNYITYSKGTFQIKELVKDENFIWFVMNKRTTSKNIKKETPYTQLIQYYLYLKKKEELKGQ